MSFSMDELAREVSERVDAALEKSREIERLSGKIVNGAATYADCERLASLTGTSTGKVLADALVQHAVDGKVAEDVARAILAKPLEDNYELIAEACRLTQEALNRKAGLGLQAVKPEMPRDRINGLVTETAGKDDIGSFAGRLVQQVENLSMSTVDDSVRENAAAHSRAGLRPKIRRIADSDCCDWCSTLEGTYDYAEVSDTGNDVFRRHANCRCQVIYDPADGKRWQDAHSKRLLSADESAKIEARKTYGLDEERKTPEQRVAEAWLRQDYESVIKPKSMEDDFVDFAPLDFRASELDAFAKVRQKSDETGFEYGVIIESGVATKPFTSSLPDKVAFDLSGHGSGLTLIHSHTNVTPLSTADFSKFVNPLVSRIGNISSNGDVFIADINGGIRPDIEEFKEVSNSIRDAVDELIFKSGDYDGYSIEEKNYIAVRETAYRLACSFEWNLMGGKMQ